MSEVLTIRVPSKIKDEMEEFEVNWSEYLRDSIRKKIIELKREKAFEKMDDIRKKTEGKEINMAKEVTKWRKRR